MIGIQSVSKHEVRRMVRECFDLQGPEAVIFGHVLSRTDWLWAGFNDEELVCVFGARLGTIANPCAYIWLHTTPAVEDCKFHFIRQSQIVRDKILVDFPTIQGHCHKDAERSIRWMSLLGASFGHPEGDLIPFQIVRKNG